MIGLKNYIDVSLNKKFLVINICVFGNLMRMMKNAEIWKKK